MSRPECQTAASFRVTESRKLTRTIPEQVKNIKRDELRPLAKAAFFYRSAKRIPPTPTFSGLFSLIITTIVASGKPNAFVAAAVTSLTSMGFVSISVICGPFIVIVGFLAPCGGLEVRGKKFTERIPEAQRQ